MQNLMMVLEDKRQLRHADRVATMLVSVTNITMFRNQLHGIRMQNLMMVLKKHSLTSS
jgi:hypothetical protein